MYDDGQRAYFQQQVMEWGPKVLIAILILLATWLVARAAKWALEKAVDKAPALKRHGGASGESLGQQLGTIVKLIIWLVGIMAALQFLGIGQILQPINALTMEIFNFLPRLIGAGLIFFIGLIVARIVRQLVETVLTAANVDGMFARIGIGSTEGTVRTDPEAVPPGTTPGATRTSLARAAGILAFALIIIPVAIAALQVLGIEAISGPAINMLNQILAAIPRVLAALVIIAVAFVIGRWVKTLLETVLPSLGFDRTVAALGVVPTTTSPSRIVGTIAMTAAILVGLMEAAKWVGGDYTAIMLLQITELGGKVIFGTIIIVAGIFLARILSNLVGSSTGESGYAQTIVKYAIIALFTAIGLTFMGLADMIVQMAFGLILGSVAVATALAFGLGGRDAAARILNRYADEVPPPSSTTPPRPKRIASTPPPSTDESQPPLV